MDWNGLQADRKQHERECHSSTTHHGLLVVFVDSSGGGGKGEGAILSSIILNVGIVIILRINF